MQQLPARTYHRAARGSKKSPSPSRADIRTQPHRLCFCPTAAVARTTPPALRSHGTRGVTPADVTFSSGEAGDPAVDLITPRPILLIVGSRAVTSWMSVDAYQRAQEPKELHWIDGASHVDLYDKNDYVTPAVAKLSEFYKTNLSAAADKLAFAG